MTIGYKAEKTDSRGEVYQSQSVTESEHHDHQVLQALTVSARKSSPWSPSWRG